MTASTELGQISYSLRRLCLSRWTQDKIVEDVTVKLPAPIFDQVKIELRRELTFTQATEQGLRDSPDYFTFGSIRFERLDGVYWSVSADDEDQGLIRTYDPTTPYVDPRRRR